ncbi:hypothetical protein [Nannocystis radixulma]|uniref:NPCBM-associated, NEW3 domain of alpha-galactosidase n=1 Tax=Nannocystis radixulma TaxID=2995305 RepID=A0ABT5BEF7_9BACT|nr:hypothetical protein [Nannocystis radixulma]MDC0672534.1 hypothetical protein [Nannocystis radixulma]
MPRRLVLGILLLAGLAAPRPAAGAPCELQGSPHRARIRVPVPGHAPLELELTGAPLVARFAAGPRAQVETLGALRIAGTALELPLALAQPVDAAGGAVHLSTEVEVVQARPHRSGLRLVVELAPRTTIGAVLSPVVVACDAVKLRAEAGPTGHTAAPANYPSWLARGRSLALRQRADGPPRLHLRASEPRSLHLDEVARRGSRIRVRAEWDDGSAVEGWADRAALVPAPRHGIGYGAWAGSGRGICGRTSGHVRKAILIAGARLHAAPGRGAWAEAREDVELDVEGTSIDGWVRVVSVPGVAEVDACGQLDHAWVARTDLTFPTP